MTKFHPLVLEAFKHAGIDPTAVQIVAGHPTGPDGVAYFTKTLPIDQVVAEHESLAAMNHTAPPGFCPRAFGIAKDERTGQAGMVSEYFELGGTKDQHALGRALAQMHRRRPEIDRFGFGVDTFCGATRQDNTWTEGWKEFFVQRRVGDLVRRLGDRTVTSEWDKMQQRAIPLLLDDITPTPQPVIVHGDLWSGNVATNRNTGQPVVYDPSSCYAHNEYDLGICAMFGGFTKAFYDAYHSVHPRSEPYHDERLKLYELYHHLNHALMFGGGYKSGALSIMRSLIEFAEVKT